MKTLTTVLSSILLLTLFTKCSSQQFDKKAPFTIKKAYYQDWIGGRAGSSGTIITLELLAPVSKKITIDSIFFKNKKVSLETNKYKNKYSLIGNFVATKVPNQDIIMDADTDKEMANTAPNLSTKIPFKLADNECVISYTSKGKKHYYKVENIKKEKTIFYP